MKREFYYQDDRSNKFWTIELVGSTCVITHGRIGWQPREIQTDFPNAAAAQREVAKLVAEKLQQGYLECPLNQVPEYVQPDWSAMTMSEAVFWRILRLFDWKRLGYDEAVIEPAVAALAQMRVDSIEQFADILAEKLYWLDTEAHAREIGNAAYEPGKRFSVDWFLYQRCAVVASGRDFYESVLADPRQMPKDVEFEYLLSLAPSAHLRRTGRKLDHDAPLSYETFSNHSGWPD